MDRVPWVSVSIAALCAVMFAVTWLIPSDPLGGGRLEALFGYWAEHPNLPLPAPLRDELPREAGEQLEELHRRALEEIGPPVAEEQEQLDALLAEHQASSEGSLLRRLSLVPARGAAQWGWLFHMFLHFGWLHLLGNLFFFYLTGTMLEDTWGRPLFAVFYGVGGVVAALAHVAMEAGSSIPMAGASGAVAACMGAFAYRFASKRVRMGYFVWIIRIWRGTFLMPAWAAGGLWFGAEIFSLVAGTSSGVAVMAHIGGFLFGLILALGLKLSGIEERYVTPAVLRKTGNFVRPESLNRASEAFERGDLADARRQALRVLEVHPDNLEARLLLYRVDRREKRPSAAGRLEHLLQQFLAKEDPADALRAVLAQLGEELDPSSLRPATAFRMARVLESQPDTAPALLEALDSNAARDTGAVGAEALVRLAERALQSRGTEHLARRHLAALELRQEMPEQTASRARALRQELDGRGQWASNLELASEHGPDSAAPPAEEASQSAALRSVPPRIIRGAVVGETASGLLLQSANGEKRPLDFAQIVGVAAGLIPYPAGEGNAPRLLPLTDLVLRWESAGQEPLVLRLELAHLGLQARYPDLKVGEAYVRWLQSVVERSGATVFPDAFALQQRRYPRYADDQAMTAALYGVLNRSRSRSLPT